MLAMLHSLSLTQSVILIVGLCTLLLLGIYILYYRNKHLIKRKFETLEESYLRQQNQIQRDLDFTQQQLEQAQDEIKHYRNRIEQQNEALGKATALAERVPELEALTKKQESSLSDLRVELSTSDAFYQMSKAKLDAEAVAAQDKITLLLESEKRLTNQFELLAQKIFEEKSTSFQKQNMSQLDNVIGPLKQQLEGFRQQVHESYSIEQAERHSLKHQLQQLQYLNQQLSQDAINLTRALKGDNKIQGNWGELILERVLQESGLRANHEYHTQQQYKDEAGKSFKPDVIVHLPDNKDIVIDAKMSLVAYEKYISSTDEHTKEQALQAHLLSIRNHIRELSRKDYQKLYGLKTLDYVLMFIPVEPAFMLAIEQQPKLMNDALASNIMLVSPTNLLVALRTINNIWRYEHQNQNAQAIAKQASKIYDKLCGYLEDMDKLGRNIDSANKSYQLAMSKLSTGKGNVIRQAQQMKQLGVTSSKNIDTLLLDKALIDHAD